MHESVVITMMGRKTSTSYLLREKALRARWGERDCANGNLLIFKR